METSVLKSHEVVKSFEVLKSAVPLLSCQERCQREGLKVYNGRDYPHNIKYIDNVEEALCSASS